MTLRTLPAKVIAHNGNKVFPHIRVGIGGHLFRHSKVVTEHLPHFGANLGILADFFCHEDMRLRFVALLSNNAPHACGCWRSRSQGPHLGMRDHAQTVRSVVQTAVSRISVGCGIWRRMICHLVAPIAIAAAPNCSVRMAYPIHYGLMRESRYVVFQYAHT